jgi:exodeoxyribonuclease (lambda-induced)
VKVFSGFEQGGLEWLTARAGVVTASEFGNLVTDKWEIRKGEMPKTYLNKKLAERWTGQPMQDGWVSHAAEDGNLLEEEARNWLAFKFGDEIHRPAFITTDDGRAGCSPDGVIGTAGIELKCPQAPNQVKYLLAGGLPEEYGPQVHFSMFVTRWQKWHFISYGRRLPKLVLVVERDEKIQAVIADALAGFLERLDAAYARLVEINGSEPKRFKPTQPQPEPADERFDINS